MNVSKTSCIIIKLYGCRDVGLSKVTGAKRAFLGTMIKIKIFARRFFSVSDQWTEMAMKRATCVGHGTMPRAPTCAFGVAFGAPRLAKNARAFSKLPKVIQVYWKLQKKKDFYIFIDGSFNQNRHILRSNVWGGLGHK